MKLQKNQNLFERNEDTNDVDIEKIRKNTWTQKFLKKI